MVVIRQFAWLALILLPALCSHAQERPPSTGPLDASEAARWGDRVVVIGEGPRAGDEMLFSAAMAPPASDNEMWFISVWGKPNHQPSSQLIAAFQKDNHLTPFVATPPDTKRAWAHFNYYRFGDPTQAWRAKDYKVGPETELPVVIIQPPLNKRFGDPRIVIDRIEAAECADPSLLQKRITSSVHAWCKKLSEQRVGLRFAAVDPAEIGVDPPFKSSPPSAEPFNPQFPKFPGLTIDIGPKPLTLEEIEEAAGPDADPAFILQQNKEKPTSKREVKLAWLVHKAEKQATKQPTPAVAPPAPPAPEPAPPKPDKSVLVEPVPAETPAPAPPAPATPAARPTSPPATTEPPVEVDVKGVLALLAVVFSWAACIGILLIAIRLHPQKHLQKLEGIRAAIGQLKPTAAELSACCAVSAPSPTTSAPSPAASSPPSS